MPTSTTSLVTTSTSLLAISSELLALLEDVLVEWNSGDTDRWRATFSLDAVHVGDGPIDNRSNDYSIDEERDGYEFLAVLQNRLELIECAPAEPAVEAAVAATCELLSPNLFNQALGLTVSGVFHFEVVDGLVVRYHGHNIRHFDTLLREWDGFRDWVGQQNPEHALLMGELPGNAAGAETALSYMDDYFGQ